MKSSFQRLKCSSRNERQSTNFKLSLIFHYIFHVYTFEYIHQYFCKKFQIEFLDQQKGSFRFRGQINYLNFSPLCVCVSTYWVGYEKESRPNPDTGGGFLFSQLIKAFFSLSANSSYSLSLFENKPRALIQVKKSLNCELDIDVKEHLGSPVKDCEHIRWDQMKKGGKWRKRKRS